MPCEEVDLQLLKPAPLPILSDLQLIAERLPVDGGLFLLEDEVFFDSISRFQGFEEFEDRIVGATHTEFAIDTTLYNRIRDRFMQHMGPDGVAEFRHPNRADLLRKH